MEAIYSRELGIKALEYTNTAQTGDYKLSTSLKLYHRLKAIGKSRRFFEVSITIYYKINTVPYINYFVSQNLLV